MKFKRRFRYNKKRVFIYMFFIMLLSTLTLGYSLLTTTLEIEGVGKISKAVWNIHFANIQTTQGSVTPVQAPTISNDTNIAFNVKLAEPTNFYEFTADIVNEGTIDAKINSFTILPVLTEAQKKYFNYTVTYAYSKGTEIKVNDALNAGTTEKILVRFEYLEQTDTSLYPTEDQEFSLQVGIDYVQGKGNEVNHHITTTTFADDSWDTIIAAVKNGDTDNYNVGDEKEVDLGTLGKHRIRIANKSTPAECSTEGFSQTACGFVLEFADIITTHNMNPTGTYKGKKYNDGWNVDGWPASSMRTYINDSIYNALPEAIRNSIINTKVVSGHGLTSGESNFTSTDKLYLLSTMEVWGSNPGGYDTATNETRQLDYYKNVGVTTSNYSGAIKQYNGSSYYWWLRSARSYSTSGFYGVNSYGNWIDYYANDTNGVSPAFRIA